MMKIPGVAVIKSVCTSYAAALVIEQLKLSAKIAYSVTVEDSSQIHVTYQNHLHRVSINDHQTSCSCSFWKTMTLPCRHIFAARASQNMNLFEKQMVKERWTKLPGYF